MNTSTSPTGPAGNQSPYAPPLDQLLFLGHPAGPGASYGWYDSPFADYAAMGIGPEHADELLRMALDYQLEQRDDDAAFGPVHAARALGALRITSAIEPLLTLLRRLDRNWDDVWSCDLANVLARMGEPAIDPVMKRLRDQRERFGLRLELTDALEKIAQQEPRLRARVVGHLTDVLKWARYNHPAVNAGVIGSLLELSAVESLPTIRAAYATRRVDEVMVGSLDEVEEKIGLTPEARSARRRAVLDKVEEKLDDLSQTEIVTRIAEGFSKMKEQSHK